MGNPQDKPDSRRKRLRWLLAVVVGSALFSCGPLVRPCGLSSDHDWLLHVARYAFVRKSVLDFGQFPYWSPYFGGGYPILGDPAGAALTPQVPFVLAFGEVVGLKVFILLMTVVQGLGMYAFLRRGVRLRAPSAAFGALMLTFSSSLPMRNWDELAYAWLPLALYLVAQVRERPRSVWPLALVLALALPQGKQCWALLVLYLFGFAGLHAIRWGRRRAVVAPAWLGALTLSVAACVLLCAAKVLPMAELFEQRRDLGMQMIRNKAPFYDPATVDALPPEQLLTGLAHSTYEPGVGLHTRCCVGWAGVVCAVIGIAMRWKRLWRYIVLMLLGAVAAVGWHSPVDLLRLLWLVPGLDTIRASAKYFDYFVCIGLCVCAASGVAVGLRSHRAWWRWRTTGLTAGLAVAALVESAVQNFPPMLDQFGWSLPAISRATSFHHRLPVARGPAAMRTTKGTSYFNLLAGVGTMNWESGFVLPEYAEPRQFVGPDDKLHDNPAYRGEVYCIGAKGNVALSHSSPNRLVVTGHGGDGSTVVINQNYHRCWQLGKSTGTASVRLACHEGKLAVTVDRGGPFEVELRFFPTAFYWGCGVSLLALVGVAIAVLLYVPAASGRPMLSLRLPRARAFVCALAIAGLACGIWAWLCETRLQASCHYELGKQCYLEGGYGSASRRFEDALNLYPTHLLAQKWLGQCHFWLGDPAKAAELLSECERVLALESDHALIYVVSRCEAGQAIEAKVVCERWMRVAPSSPHVWASRAVVLAYDGQERAAADALERAAYLGLNDLAVLSRFGRFRGLLDGGVGQQTGEIILRIWQGQS